MSEEKILTNAPRMDYFCANTFTFTFSLRLHKWEHFYFYCLQLFSLNIEWHSSSYFSLYSSRLPHTCGPFYSPQIISKLKWKQWCLGSLSPLSCRRDRGLGTLTLHRERNLRTRLAALCRKREGPENDINCCAQDGEDLRNEAYFSLLRERTLGTRLITVYKEKKD